MKKAEFALNREYIFNPEHKGAPYSLNGGENWMNHGDLCEAMFKSVLGLEAKKDACGSYDKTDDVPELGASVKSGNCTLVNKVLGYDFDSVKKFYFATCHSTSWVWVSIKDETLTAYYMSREEFENFMDNWASFAKDRKVIRFKKESLIMLNWLEQRVD